MGKICEVCGKPSGMYPLCKECLQLKLEGKVAKCPVCKKWRYTHEVCPHCGEKSEFFEVDFSNIKGLKTEEVQYKSANFGELDDKNILKCIICGKNSNGMHFCRACYQKYKDREIDIHIKNCVEFSISDEYGNLRYECDDGKKVRSRAEALISNFLFNNKIRSVYEKTVYYTENGETKTLHPDFYLPDFDTYIEYNELTNRNYLQSKAYSEKIYKEIGFKVIVMNDEDLLNIAACLKPKLGLH